MVIQKVLEIRGEQPRIGGRKLYKLLSGELQQPEVKVGRDKFFSLLSEAGLLIKRKRKHVSTTNSHHRFYTYNNLLKNKLLSRSQQAYVADITYLRTQQGFVYLFLLTDAYSRKIVGWNLSNSLGIDGGLSALKMAIKHTNHPEGLIHHSDRGIQYCSNGYVKLLKKHKIQISMTEENHCYENGLAERVNGILKEDFLLDAVWPDYVTARKAVAHAVETYNNRRPHWSLGLQVPSVVHQKAG